MWRITHGEVPEVNMPKVVMVLIGESQSSWGGRLARVQDADTICQIVLGHCQPA